MLLVHLTRKACFWVAGSVSGFARIKYTVKYHLLGGIYVLPCQDTYCNGDINWFSLFPETQILSEVLKKEIIHDIEEISPLDRVSPLRAVRCQAACGITVMLGFPVAPVHEAPTGVAPQSCRS